MRNVQETAPSKRQIPGEDNDYFLGSVEFLADLLVLRGDKKTTGLPEKLGYDSTWS